MYSKERITASREEERKVSGGQTNSFTIKTSNIITSAKQHQRDQQNRQSPMAWMASQKAHAARIQSINRHTLERMHAL